LSDILKRTPGGNSELLGSQSETDFIEYCGIQFKKTSTVPTTTISSNTYYVTYIVGDDAVFSVSLGKTPGGGMNLQPRIGFAKPGSSSGYDPAGVIGGWAAYNFKWTASPRPNSTMALRRLISMTSTS
jgi:hypothetical protein